MNEYLFHRSFQIITSFHMHQYIELDFPYIWFTQVGADDGMLPIRRQAITWINDDILSIRP